MGNFHPAALAITLTCGVLLLVLPRRWAMLPFLVAAVFVTPEQRIIVGGFDFTSVRILIVFALMRLVGRGELRGLELLTLDWILISFLGWATVAYTLQVGSVSALVNRLGYSFTVLGGYLFARTILRGRREIIATLQSTALINLVLVCFMAVEWSTGRNHFSAIGGVPEYSLVRAGRLRCQGAFSHPIMAGMFGACWAPLYLGVWLLGRRALAAVGFALCVVIVFFSSSSTPVASLGLGIIGFYAWYARPWLRWLRIAIFCSPLILQLFMDKPFWHIIARANLIGGSTGYHRYHLIDQFIRHFSEWALIGTRSVTHWGPDLHDVTNQYVAAGITGGILALGLLIALLSVALSETGRTAACTRLPVAARRMAWSAGAALFVHLVAFTGVTYFGQMSGLWFVQLALVGSFTAVRHQAERAAPVRPRRARAPAPAEPSETAGPARVPTLARPKP